MASVDPMVAGRVSNSSGSKRQGQHSTRGGAKDEIVLGSSQTSARGRDATKRPFRPYHSINVPRRSDLETDFLSKHAPVTTIMLRNIPNRYTQASLIDELDGVGFSGRYDFFYLPMDVHNRTNVGYAFINFLTPEDAQRFYNIFKEYMFKRHSSKKIAGVSPAHVQGLLSNLEHFLNRAVTQSRDSQYRPIVFLDGQRWELQEALAKLKPQAAVDSTPCQYQGRVLLPWERPGFPTVNANKKLTRKLPEARNLPEPPEPNKFSPVREDLRLLAARVQELQPIYSPVEQAFATPEFAPARTHNSYAAPPVEQVPATRVAKSSAQDTQQYDEAFLDARKAFEYAISNLLQTRPQVQPPPGLNPSLCGRDQYDEAHENGSRTGTPRSTTSSADERLKENLGFQNSDDLTPRTSKHLLGYSFSSSFAV
mmetsp:Transcript_87121/g.137496  ORF Transcript_87121/g.137496 Transcript_87121/m.137496 type:complete len:424 (-) Transcript_87121:79-1350(-)